MKTVYVDIFCIDCFDFIYWYVSTDGKNYILQSLNVGEKQCNDIYSIFGVERNELKPSYDKELGSCFIYQTNYKNENMINTKYILRAFDCDDYNAFMKVMDLYDSGNKMPIDYK